MAAVILNDRTVLILVYYSTAVTISRDTMRLFRIVRKCWQMMGIYSIQSNKTSSLNWKILFSAVSIGAVFISSTAFLCLKSTSVYEYGNSFYASTSELMILADFVVTVWQMPKTLQLIEMCENFIEMSKSRAL